MKDTAGPGRRHCALCTCTRLHRWGTGKWNAFKEAESMTKNATAHSLKVMNIYPKGKRQSVEIF